MIEQVTYRYACGCSATGGPLLPTYCPEHGMLERSEPSVPVSALRALVKDWERRRNQRMPNGYAMCADELAALCDAEERKP
jgi:hypothetical protein